MIVASMKTAIAIPTPMLLIVITSARAKAAKTADHHQRRPGDHRRRSSPGPPPPRRCCRRSAGRPPGFATGADLVVHRQAEQHAEHDDRVAGDRVAERIEREHVRQVAFLEDPDERSERRADRQQRHQDGLDRQDERTEQQEQDHPAREQRDPDAERRTLCLRDEEVVAERGRPANLGRDAVAGIESARTTGIIAFASG